MSTAAAVAVAAAAPDGGRVAPLTGGRPGPRRRPPVAALGLSKSTALTFDNGSPSAADDAGLLRLPRLMADATRLRRARKRARSWWLLPRERERRSPTAGATSMLEALTVGSMSALDAPVVTDPAEEEDTTGAIDIAGQARLRWGGGGGEEPSRRALTGRLGDAKRGQGRA